jgi:hypothetical protein
VLSDIERTGVLPRGPGVAAQSQRIEEELATYSARIYELPVKHST